jgi:hypothetical protein
LRNWAFILPFRLGQLMFCETSCCPHWGTLVKFKGNGFQMITSKRSVTCVIYTGEHSMHQLDDDTQTWCAWEKSEEARFSWSELTPLRQHTRLLEKLKSRGRRRTNSVHKSTLRILH